MTDYPEPQTLETLSRQLPHIQQSPKIEGTLALIVRRPQVDAREVLPEGELNLAEGLAGDTWNRRSSSRTPDGSPHPDMQLNLMNVRVIEAIAGRIKRWPLAGDQLFVDLDLSQANVPPGTRLSIGNATIEITPQPHRGCDKFAARFGVDALKFVNSPEGRLLGLRGVNAKVIRPGRVRTGDVVRKLNPL
ncbi:MAG: MOSC domain-containing protein [Acidobacteria bacterium]|nr:MOSC domain-containing protein [Acidobacteriota bacterium]